MKSINIGIIGCGSIANSIVPFFKLTKGIHIASFCDKNLEKAAKLQKKHRSATIYDDYMMMIENENLDAVYVALPHYLHYPVLKNLISHHIHVFVEKPITINVDQAMELKRLAYDHQVKVAVNYQYRYDRSLYQLTHSVLNGELGELFFGRCIVPWHRDTRYFSDAPWHSKKEEAGGGTLMTQGSHLLDMLLMMYGSEVKTINGVSKNFRFKQNDVEDFSSFTIQFDNGSILQFICTLASPVEKKTTLELYCDKSVAIYSSKLFSKVRFTSHSINRHSHGIRGIHPIHMSIKGFRNWLLFDQPHLCTIDDSIKVLKTVNDIYERTLTKED